MTLKDRMRKTLKVLATAAISLLTVVIAAVLLILARPVREKLLDVALDRARRSLPGELTASDARWPSPGIIEIDGLMWIDGADTLAAAGGLRISADLTELLARDLHIRDLSAVGISADIPAIAKRFGGAPGDSTRAGKAEGTKGPGSGFPRQGSVPGIPSIAVDWIDVEGRRILVANGIELIGLRLRARMDLLSGSEPFLSIEELTLDRSSTPVSADSLWLRADLSAPSINGRGIIGLPLDTSARMVCHTEPDGSFTVRIVPAGVQMAQTGAFLSVSGLAAAEDRRLESVDFEMNFLTPGTEELTAIPFLDGQLQGTGPLEGIRGSARGHIGLSPPFKAAGGLYLSRTSYIDTLHIACEYEKGRIAVDTMLLEMPGLLIRASGSITEGVPDLSAQLSAASMAWLTRIFPGVTLPDGTCAELALETGDGGGPDGMPILIEGHAAAGGVSIDSIRVSGVIPAGKGRTYAADLMIDTYGARIITSASVDLASGLDLTLSRPAVRSPDPDTVFLAGRVTVDGESGGVAIRNLHTDGMLGRVSVNADLAGKRSGSFDILGEWPEPPSPLRAAVSADSSAWDSITAIWSADGPFELHVRGSLSSGGRGISVSGDARMPGPRLLGPIAGTGDVFADLGPLMIDFEAGLVSAGSKRSIEGHFDLSRTEWIDTALVSIGSRDGSLTVEKMLIIFEGLRLSATGGISGDQLDLEAAVSLADSVLVRRLGRLAGRDVSMTLDARCALSGKRNDPDVSIGIDGSMSTLGLMIPGFSGTAERIGGITRADLSLQEGLAAKAVRFDTITATYRDDVTDADSSGAAVRIDAHGRDIEILLAFHLPEGDGFFVLADTLFTEVSGRTLASTGSFAVSSLGGSGLRIEGLSLEGSIGSIRADGIASPDSADIEAHIDIVLPDKPEVIRIPDRLWPGSVIMDARAEGPSKVTVDGRISGLTIGDERETDLDFGLVSDQLALQANMYINVSDKIILSLDGTFPPLQSNGSLVDGPIRIDLGLDEAPIPRNANAIVSDDPGQIGLLSGRIAVRGSLSEPEAAILLDCSFTGGKELEKYVLSIDGKYARAEISDTTLTRLLSERTGKRERAGASSRTAGVMADLHLAKSDRTVFSGILEYPAVISMLPFLAGRPDTAAMLLEVRSEGLELTDLDPLLPPDVNLEGVVEVFFRAAGNVDNPGFGGRLETKNMSFAVANVLQASPTVDLEIGGDFIRPSLKGSIVIDRALLRIPEMKKSMHDTGGKSILRDAADSFRVATGALDTVPPDMDESGTGESRAAAGMDIDVTISIPNSFRVESEFLNLELEGNLLIRQEGDRPVITGELKPRTGRLAFMGRYFEIQKGSVFFYGEDEMNPSFDLSLKAKVTDIDIFIKLTGTAFEPEIELSSNPSKSESDIMSLLLFGRTMNDLNGSQSNLLQQRTAEILMVFGASKLEGEMSRMLGVDRFTFQQSTRDPNRTSLMVGKYINNRTMLKYEQGLENTANFLINLEYRITRQLKLETFIDQGSETGLEINWSREY